MEKEQKHSLANDIAEHVKLQQQYDSLYNQSMTILNSLPVAVAVYNAKRKDIVFQRTFLPHIWDRYGRDGRKSSKHIRQSGSDRRN